MIITNFKNLAHNSLRQKALLMAEAGYQAIEIEKTVRRKIKINKEILNIDGKKINLANFKRIFLIGIGKGSALASAFLAKILNRRLTKAIALDVIKLKTKNQKLKTFVGTHPLASKQNVKATQKIIQLAKNAAKNDLIISFIAGGGSALACASQSELKASQTIFKELTKKGADIFELNTVRKHLSEIKAGGLAKMAYPATIISLIVSDVPGNDLAMVASGPTVLDKTMKKDAEKIIKKYQVSSIRYQVNETPKDKKYFKKVKNILFLSNAEPVSAMSKKAKKLGFKPKIYSLKIQGEAKKSLFPLIKEVKKGKVILGAGETTVRLKKYQVSGIKYQKGKGGRNMESVLGILNTKYLILNTVVLAFASDGRDNTEAAGAIADFSTLEKAEKMNLNPQKFLDQNNSFNFFKKTKDLIFVKPKSFNVSDLMIILKK
jgi:glycerate 2-kinase